MNAHTPGPWTVGTTVSGRNYNANIIYAPTADPKTASGIASVNGIPMHRGVHEIENCTSLANARLIAAAPELLEACKALDAAFCDGFDTQAQRHAGRMALIAARAAIAKAEGK